MDDQGQKQKPTSPRPSEPPKGQGGEVMGKGKVSWPDEERHRAKIWKIVEDKDKYIEELEGQVGIAQNNPCESHINAKVDGYCPVCLMHEYETQKQRIAELKEKLAKEVRLTSMKMEDQWHAESRLAEAMGLLKVAKCPACDGSGCIPHQVDDDTWDAYQCQWCDEKNTLLDLIGSCDGQAENK